MASETTTVSRIYESSARIVQPHSRHTAAGTTDGLALSVAARSAAKPSRPDTQRTGTAPDDVEHEHVEFGDLAQEPLVPETRKVPRPSYAQLVQDLETMSYCAVGRKYGVSDNAIRKWLKWYERQAERQVSEAA